jgi:Domain of unknown function (DUF397)
MVLLGSAGSTEEAMSGNPFDRGWHISSYSSAANSACVEVLLSLTEARVRHSKDREGPTLTFTKDEWSAFISGVRNGEFDY